MENYRSPMFSQDLKQFLMIEPIQVNNEGTVPHLVQRTVSTKQQEVPTALTFRNIHVEQILTWDEKSNTV